MTGHTCSSSTFQLVQSQPGPHIETPLENANKAMWSHMFLYPGREKQADLVSKFDNT